METPDTTPVQGDGGDVDMADEPVFKVPNKRKKQEDIKEFLRNTKWQKNVALEEFFPDRKQFIHDVKFFRREGAFVDVEIFRLKKLIARYTLNITRDIVRSLKALEIEIVELQRLEATGDRGHIEALKIIGQDVLEVLRDSMNVGQLPLSCRRAVLYPAPKKGDLTHLKNWCPVSLLCTDIRLLSKALEPKVMEQITQQDQSYCVPDRGRTLVINNLAASSLWHKLACVDLPPNLLASIQALLVDFFWDGLHWIPQSVLHLPKEEEGQGGGPVSQQNCSLQFLQRLLTGPKDLI
ncbi:hypothetical protein QTP86_008572 [Hemibagrus guttatus]|nr:hypothetical protein QTP86_008572 [Hemibagrus guttatus]